MDDSNTAISLQTFSKESYDEFSKNNQLLCVVCGSIAHGYYFNAITCMSCKIFFRRNASKSFGRFICYQEGNCQITPRTRRYCTYCRLVTCFRMGMQKQLIRKNKQCSQTSINKDQQIQTMHPPLLRPLDLLRWSDRSQLSNNDWLLLRRLSSVFDSLTHNIMSKAHEIHHQLLSIGIQPLKVRAKASYIYDMVNIFAGSVLEFIKSIPQLTLLPPLNKQALLLRNTRPVIMFHSYYQMHFEPTQNIAQTPYWIASMNLIFLPSVRHLHDEINYRVGHVSFTDPCLIKLILVILAFSTNNIDHDQITLSQHLNEYYHTIVLHKVQSMYVELMWKYIIYRFGEQRAIHLFADIIRTILRVQLFVSILENSDISSERKFDENITKLTDQIMQFNFGD